MLRSERRVVSRIQSDHSPIQATFDHQWPRTTPSFRFLAAWLTDPSFSQLVKDCWRHNLPIHENIPIFSKVASYWNSHSFGSIGRRRRVLAARIAGIQRTLEDQPPSNFLNTLLQTLTSDYETSCFQEELLWLQKSRAEWINFGDRNTHYYHTKARVRRSRNRISTLKNPDGMWISDNLALPVMVRDYFISLYSADASPHPVYNHRGLFPTLPSGLWDSFNADVTVEEVRLALFDMKPLKAPGPDGLHALFFQSQWPIVGPSLYALVADIFAGQPLHESLNHTSIALLPKVSSPTTVKDFRPISLCSVVYKLITKIISKRLRDLMPLLISPAQSSFIKGRSIIDNIIITQEVIHSMKKKRGKKGWLVIKVDLEKAFDKLSWDFIEDTLLDAGFPTRMVRIILHCVTTSTLSVLWNGQPTQPFKPSRGIRQGDPLSPYLFVLCMERLSQAISRSVQAGQWKPIKLGRFGPPLSHLFFADDLILFGDTSKEQETLINSILHEFG